MTTIIIVRLASMLSWIWTAPAGADVVRGVYRNVSKPSYTEWKACSLPPGSKFGFILSRKLRKRAILFKFFADVIETVAHNLLQGQFGGVDIFCGGEIFGCDFIYSEPLHIFDVV